MKGVLMITQADHISAVFPPHAWLQYVARLSI